MYSAFSTNPGQTLALIRTQGSVDVAIRVQPAAPSASCTVTLASLSKQQLRHLRAFILAARELAVSFTVPAAVSDV
jgi:hypothetical protein